MPPRIEQADWLDFVGSLPPQSVDLLYADPPFNTGRSQRGTPRQIKGPTVREGVSDARTRTDVALPLDPPAAKAEKEKPETRKNTKTPSLTVGPGIGSGETVSLTYPDTWPSVDAWLAWLRERLTATLPALKPTASILLHVDWRTSHHARLLLDDLLAPENFVNHLIWSYGLGGSSPRRFARKHDDILFYAIDPERYFFEPPMVPATSNRMKGELKKATDLLEIPAINNMASERTGYPTQKPMALLELIIGACCPEGGTVLDPVCGSGTTLAAAASLGRSAIGCDINPGGVAIARRRLETQASGVRNYPSPNEARP